MLYSAKLAAVLLRVVSFTAARGYIPAYPTDGPYVASAQDISNMSSFGLQWYPDGWLVSTMIRHHFPRRETGFIVKGAVVHFAEDNLSSGQSSIPWVALVCCDANSTSASTEIDVVTLAYQRGAIAVLLYSLTAEYCALNVGWYDNLINHSSFLDVFTVQSRAVSRLMEYQLLIVANFTSKYYWFDPVMLNASGNAVGSSMINGRPVQQGYVFGTLGATNIPPTPGGLEGGSLSNQLAAGLSHVTGPIRIVIIAGSSIITVCVFIAASWIHARRHQPPIWGAQRGKETQLASEVLPTAMCSRPLLPTSPSHIQPSPLRPLLPDVSPMLTTEQTETVAPSSNTGAAGLPHTAQVAEELEGPSLVADNPSLARGSQGAVAGSLVDSHSGIAPSTIPPSYQTNITAAPSYHTRCLSPTAMAGMPRPSPGTRSQIHPSVSHTTSTRRGPLRNKGKPAKSVTRKLLRGSLRPEPTPSALPATGDSPPGLPGRRLAVVNINATAVAYTP